MNMKYFIIIVLAKLIISNVCQEQYCVKKNPETPTYIYSRIKVENNYFPQNVTIKLNLQKTKGTIWYSIDRYEHQVILYIENEAEMTIRLNNKATTFLLFTLCDCRSCKSKDLRIWIHLNDSFYIQCNDMRSEKFNIDTEGKLNGGYPRPFEGKTITKGQSNTADIYLLNTPDYNFDGITPNNHQPEGVIYEVNYNNVPIIFSLVTKYIDRGCRERIHYTFMANSTIPTYLYSRINNIKNGYFPSNVTIRLFLTKIAGTLWYSIDQHLNKLIISFEDNDGSPKLIIKLNTIRKTQHLSELCGCANCSSQDLLLWIHMNDTYYVRCNNGNPLTVTRGDNIKVGYPMNGNVDKPLPNIAELYIGNTPYEACNNSINNETQLEGIVSDIRYNNEPIPLILYTNIAKKECLKQKTLASEKACWSILGVLIFLSIVIGLSIYLKSKKTAKKKKKELSKESIGLVVKDEASTSKVGTKA